MVKKAAAVAFVLILAGAATALQADANVIGGQVVTQGSTWWQGIFADFLPWGILGACLAAMIAGEQIMHFLARFAHFLVPGIAGFFAVALLGFLGLNAAGATLH